MNVDYSTRVIEKEFAGHKFQLEVVQNLGEAIDELCKNLGEDQINDPFAGDLCPYFGVLWSAAEGLSQFLVKHPELIENKKILEIGCGLGLPSMVATQLGADVLATDFHPHVESFFKKNSFKSKIECKYQRLDWLDDKNELGAFDVVIGADILYEGRHARDVAEALFRYCKPQGLIILADPDRGQLKRFKEHMLSLGLIPRIFMEESQGERVQINCYQR